MPPLTAIRSPLYGQDWQEANRYSVRPMLRQRYRHCSISQLILNINQSVRRCHMRTVLKYGSMAAIVILLACPALHAQDKLEITGGYNVNIPAGSFKDYVTHPGYKGFTVGLAYPINDQLRVGLSFGYNDFYQKYPRQVYDDGKSNAISSVLTNSVQQL